MIEYLFGLLGYVPREQYLLGLQDRQSKIVNLRQKIKHQDKAIVLQRNRIEDLRETCDILSREYTT